MSMTIRQAEALLAPLCGRIKFRRRDGEWRIALRGMTAEREEATCYYTDDAQDAVDTAYAMVAPQRCDKES